jgi:hypothetical protein
LRRLVAASPHQCRGDITARPLGVPPGLVGKGLEIMIEEQTKQLPGLVIVFHDEHPGKGGQWYKPPEPGSCQNDVCYHLFEAQPEQVHHIASVAEGYTWEAPIPFGLGDLSGATELLVPVEFLQYRHRLVRIGDMPLLRREISRLYQSL